MALVSVVTSTYNRSTLLLRTVRSVLAQRGVDLEHVVVDNGSTDDTAQRLATIEDDRLRVIRNDVSRGPTGGRNTGLAAARGDWLAIVDDDDVWAPDKLRAQLDALASTGRHFAYTGCVYIDGDERIIGGQPPPPPDAVMETLPRAYPIPAGISNVIWRTGSLDGDGLLDEETQLTTDWDLALRLARHGPPAWVPRPLIGYRQHGGNISRHAGRFQEEFAHIAAKFADLGVPEQIDLRVRHRFVASEAIRVGDRGLAARAYLAGVRAGDLGCLLRAPALLLPRRAQPWVRRRLLSDAEWLDRAETELAPVLGAVA